MKNVELHLVPIDDSVKEFSYVSKKGITHVFKDLGGEFKWIVVGNTTLIVPKYFEEFQVSQLTY